MDILDLTRLKMSTRNLSSNDDIVTSEEMTTTLNTLYINLFIFLVLMGFFEIYRTIKSVYLKRSTKRFKV